MKNYIKQLTKIINASHDIKFGRLSSFPFISGDGFRMMCDFIIESRQDLENFEKTIYIYLKLNKKVKIFVSLGFIENPFVREMLTQKIEKLNFLKFGDIKLIFHNGDKVPDIHFFNYLHKFAKLYSVNVNDSIDCVTGIPIGLENYHHMNNGLMMDFIAFKQQKIEPIERDTIVLGSFNEKTNPSERLVLKNSILNFGFKFHGSNLSRKKYINYLQRSLFVASPPGNGLDCHRTWEALLMGAVPIIKSDTLSKNIVENTPILEVENWDNFFSLQQHQMKTIYQQKINESLEKCYMQYWIKTINGNCE